MNEHNVARALSSVFCGVLGDGIGLPFEKMSTREIFDITDGIGVSDFTDVRILRSLNINNPRKLSYAQTSDETQLTLCVLRSLINTRGVFSPADCMKEHIKEYRLSTFGWGKNTRNAIENLIEKRANNSPKPRNTCSNDVAMKVAPLAISSYFSNDNSDYFDQLKRDVILLGLITHLDIMASISALAIAMFIKQSLSYGFRNGNDVYDFLQYIIEKVIETEKEHEKDRHKVLLSKKLQEIRLNMSPFELSQKFGCGFSALQTTPFVIGMFIRNPTDIRAGILETVNSGGDTDTNASIIGNMIGANINLDYIPPKWVGIKNKLFLEISIMVNKLYNRINF